MLLMYEIKTACDKPLLMKKTNHNTDYERLDRNLGTEVRRPRRWHSRALSRVTYHDRCGGHYARLPAIVDQLHAHSDGRMRSISADGYNKGVLGRPGSGSLHHIGVNISL